MLKNNFIFVSLFAFSCVSTHPGFQKVGSEVPFKELETGWLEYSKSSRIAINSIEKSNLQGKWAAYSGVYNAGGIKKGIFLTKPFCIWFLPEGLKRKENDILHPYELIENKIYGFSSDPFDTGIINYISQDSLTITWKYIPPRFKQDEDRFINPNKTYLTRNYYRKE